MNQIKLGSKTISRVSRPYIIAEIGVNHEGSMDTARRLIELAKEGGADAAKFQTYKAETLASKNSPSYWDTTKEPTRSQFALFKKHDSFGEEEYRQLAEHCVKVGIDFLSTPFDLRAVDFLDPWQPLIKIASADLTCLPLLRKVASKGKPVILSTGSATMDEIAIAVGELRASGCKQIALLQCILNYPCDDENANLGMIGALQRAYPELVIGYSDHTCPDEEMFVATTAVSLGARIIEKHFTHDKTLPGNDHYHAMDVHDLKRLCANMDRMYSILGSDEKHPIATEEISRANARRSIVISKDIAKGTVLDESYMTFKRPGHGVSPLDWDRVQGLRVTRDLAEDDVLQWDDLEGGAPKDVADAAVAAEADALFQRLFPICRSITGDGVRETLKILRETAPEFEVHEYKSGTQVFDWVIPREWNIKDAWIKDEAGNRIVDFQKSNVHVVGYSTPVDETVDFETLKAHLHTLPNLPNAIPYRTSYYKENWGFCMSHAQFETLDPSAKYSVKIDSELKDGSLTLADAVLRGGEGEKEYLISTYCCHPSLANDNLSGPILTTLLFNALKQRKLRHNYRFVILPETIGAIAYSFHNEAALKKVDGGFVVTTNAGPGPLGYKQSFDGIHAVDRAVRLSFEERGIDYIQYPFVPDGSDERQYSSPGFRIPVGTISKDKYYEYDYYHTSLDNLDFVKGEYLAEALEMYLAAIDKLEGDEVYRRTEAHCEIQLGKRGLYPNTGGAQKQSAAGANGTKGVGQGVREADPVDAISWFLFLADGETSLIDMSERSGVPFHQLREFADILVKEGLVERAPLKILADS